jgi:hypothetical protein
MVRHDEKRELKREHPRAWSVPCHARRHLAHGSAGPRAELMAFERTFPCNLEPVPDAEPGESASNCPTSAQSAEISAGFARRGLCNFLNINDVLGATHESPRRSTAGSRPRAARVRSERQFLARDFAADQPARALLLGRRRPQDRLAAPRALMSNHWHGVVSVLREFRVASARAK